MTPQINQKPVYAPGKDAYPPETLHVGTYMHRVQPLLVCIYFEGLRKLVGCRVEYFAIESSFHDLITEAPQSPQAHVFGVIGVLGYIKRVMPLRIEGPCVSGQEATVRRTAGIPRRVLV